MIGAESSRTPAASAARATLRDRFRGPLTLFEKEIRRFLRVPGQTLVSPVITTVLYLVVFGYALGGRLREVQGMPYMAFIVPGLVMLGVISNSFLNTSSSMFIMKLQETVVDLLVSPLRYGEIVAAMVGAASVRALAVGLMTWVVASIALGDVVISHLFYAIAFPVLTSIGLSALGLFVGIWADKFEHVNLVPTFVITPLTFLGGVFYDVNQLPGFFATLSRFNPVLYLVDGMRYGLLGTSAIEPAISLVLLIAFDVLAIGICLVVLRTGWKLRS
ncbi:ABC transporter permease [Vulgatibacter incomptus]|uniref:Transport permease protein n=1 Tax=Vulgatibacter incomptus TaxID=1391653 RepID=A0A0K1PFW7_9BACT|nr:ABC transporter permease [Vulgatibacter incomptus]AKU92428.1 ABC-type multidrug transport system, permease component [Vulgatibacter incomptus]